MAKTNSMEFKKDGLLTLEVACKRKTIAAQIAAIKKTANSTKDLAEALALYCPHVCLHKYACSGMANKHGSPRAEDTEHALHGLEEMSQDGPSGYEMSHKSGHLASKGATNVIGANSAPSIPSPGENQKIRSVHASIHANGTKPPAHIAVVEEHLLYGHELTRERLNEIVDAVKEEISEHDLIHVHRMLSNALMSSWRHKYSPEYDRWLVLSAIKLSAVAKSDEYALEYFPAIVTRVKESTNAFRDRAIVLSNYFTQSVSLHHSAESLYFYNDIPSRPIVEEENYSPEEDDDDALCITTIAEYSSVVKETSFFAGSPEKISGVVRLLPHLLLKESVQNIKRYGLEIIEAFISVATKEAADVVCAVLLVDDMAYHVFHTVYNRSKYSFHFRHTLVACLANISSRLRKDVSLKILNTYLSHNEYSKEDKKLGIDTLQKFLWHSTDTRKS